MHFQFFSGSLVLNVNYRISHFMSRMLRICMVSGVILARALAAEQYGSCPYQKIHPWPAVALSRAAS
jgi:hypothetical protein